MAFGSCHHALATCMGEARASVCRRHAAHARGPWTANKNCLHVWGDLVPSVTEGCRYAQRSFQQIPLLGAHQQSAPVAMQAKAPVRAPGPGLAPTVRTPAAAPSRQQRRPGATQQLWAAPKPAGNSNDGAAEQPAPAIDYPDPQAKFFRYGRFFGGGYKLDADWLKDVPQVRVRNSETRKMDEMLELAVLNERLAGTMTPWEARRKLEYLKMRRRNWERVYAYITEQEVTASLELIEEAYAKVGMRACTRCCSMRGTSEQRQRRMSIAGHSSTSPACMHAGKMPPCMAAL